MKRYEVRWTNFDPTHGAEMAKTRPAEVAVDQIRTLSKARLGKKMAALTQDDAAALRRMVTEMYGE